jgi:hypothetical protein
VGLPGGADDRPGPVGARARLAALKPDELTAIVHHAAAFDYEEIGSRFK